MAHLKAGLKMRKGIISSAEANRPSEVSGMRFKPERKHDHKELDLDSIPYILTYWNKLKLGYQLTLEILRTYYFSIFIVVYIHIIFLSQCRNTRDLS